MSAPDFAALLGGTIGFDRVLGMPPRATQRADRGLPPCSIVKNGENGCRFEGPVGWSKQAQVERPDLAEAVGMAGVLICFAVLAAIGVQ